MAFIKSGPHWLEGATQQLLSHVPFIRFPLLTRVRLSSIFGFCHVVPRVLVVPRIPPQEGVQELHQLVH